MIHIVRAVFMLTVLALSISIATNHNLSRAGEFRVIVVILAPMLVALAVMLIDIFWRRKNLSILSGLFFGLLTGLAMAYVLGLVVDLVAQVFPGAAGHQVTQLVKVLIGATAVFLCTSFVIQTRDHFRFMIPYVEFVKQTKGPRSLLLDTSVIIDGRIADIAETRILESQMLVPRFVLAELQAIADSSDKLRRNRGRRGLDMLNRLQNNSKIDIKVFDAAVPGVDELPDVDTKLVALAKHLQGRVMTNDYNLNKVAQLRGVDVININDLANAMKPVVLPGEAMSVKIVKPGEEMGQGVGYLEDGTMVVVEQGREHIGQDVALTVTSVLQTSAGRMIFGRVDTGNGARVKGRH